MTALAHWQSVQRELNAVEEFMGWYNGLYANSIGCGDEELLKRFAAEKYGVDWEGVASETAELKENA